MNDGSPTHHENAGGAERAPKRAQRGPYTGRGASTVGLLGDRTRIFYTGLRSTAMIGMMIGFAGCAVASHPLAALPLGNRVAAEENLLGITAYNNGDWEQAKTHFSIAVQADPRLAEAHFNLALTLHKLGDHDGARQHFQKAGDLAPSKRAIIEATFYRNHLGLSTTLERHLSGGYR